MCISSNGADSNCQCPCLYVKRMDQPWVPGALLKRKEGACMTAELYCQKHVDCWCFSIGLEICLVYHTKGFQEWNCSSVYFDWTQIVLRHEKHKIL